MMEVLYERPKSLQNKGFGYCPGCLHGVVDKLICELVDEMGWQDDLMCVLPIGCGTMLMFAMDFDGIVSAHGRAPAVATGVKRNKPERPVIVKQGDGDLAAIGTAEIIHAANRGENFTVIFVNNGIYGMTGGQMAPTTLPGQKASTAKNGRSIAETGYPMHMCELISQLTAPKFVMRTAVDSPANIRKTRAAIKKGFEIQMSEEGGFSFIEILSNCPTNWGLSPADTIKWIREKSMAEFPLGVYKDVTADNGDDAAACNVKKEV